MYATQPILPLLRTDYHASEAAVGATISILTLACALAAPFVGPFADRIGRKRVIVGSIFALALVTLAAAGAQTLDELLAWRFAQGLLMPGVFAVTVAYVAEEFPTAAAGLAIAAYVAGNVLGGFLGRFVTALVAGRSDWHQGFIALAALNLVGGAIVLATLPRARRFVPSTSTAASFAAMARFARTPILLCIYGVGASVLFSLIAVFTFITFRLAEPPFSLGTTDLGDLFFVYLAGIPATLVAGRMVDRFGHRVTALAAVAMCAAGVAITLSTSLWLVVAGLVLLATGTFWAQTASQGLIGKVVESQRSSAVALYLTVYYILGGLGAIVPAAFWKCGGWPATVALVIAVQLLAGALTWFGWRGQMMLARKDSRAPNLGT